jgi:hypothetical protein
LYSEVILRGTLSGQHLSFRFRWTDLALSCMVPLGFFCGGFSSTAGYVPGNEARRTFIPKNKFSLSGVALIS